jgi:murein DD-endopeptidase MepM/ murein hydrolase activator NlpD
MVQHVAQEVWFSGVKRLISGSLILLAASLGWAMAQQPDAAVYDILKAVKQGETVTVVIRQAAGQFDQGSVAMAGRTAPLFLQETGDYVALVPVSVTQTVKAYPLTVQDRSGAVLHTETVVVQPAYFPRQNISVSKKTKGLEPLPGEMEAIGALKNRVTPVRFWQEPFKSPTPDCMNSRFGVLRYHNGKPTGDYHKGVDLRSPAGRPVKAITAGKVQIAKMYRLHGGTIGLDHGQGVSSIYIHLSKLAKKEGDAVAAGETVGYVGSTGFATGPHLHWGLYVNGLPVNPVQWIQGVPRC